MNKVKCEANNCTFHKSDGSCSANEVVVTGGCACTSEQTQCQSFVPKV